ncbi:MAG: PDZ domain-containing protein [Calothrix sp. MO_167.B12]|nr:PDZ domain-containing protein [Calothrix sp. MO_167.B12]
MIAYGLAVAISTTTVERFLATANNINKPRRLGVTLKPVIIGAKRQPTLGLLVLSVNHRSYAEAAGVQIGDIIFGVSGRFLQQVEDLTYYLQPTNDKELLALQILRGGTQIVVNVAFDKDKTTYVS